MLCFSHNYVTQSTSVILLCIIFVMNFLWLVVLLADLSQSSNENAAHRIKNAVPKNENLVSQSSNDVNGSPSSSVPPPSKLNQEYAQLPNAGSQSVEPSRIQPKLLDTEELRAGLQWSNQNEVKWREVNSSLTWWWIRRHEQLNNGQQKQYKMKWVHRRWRQQPPPPLSQQQYYRWRHQQPVSASLVQTVIKGRRQNPTTQGNYEKILNQPQQNQEGGKNVLQVDKFSLWETIRSKTPNGIAHSEGQLAQNKSQNSAIVEIQNSQKLRGSTAEKSQNQTSNQLNTNKIHSEKKKLLNARNYLENSPRALNSEQQKFEQEKKNFGLSSQLPPSKLQLPVSKPQISPSNQTVQQSNSTFSSSEAEEESASSSDSLWRNKELYPMGKPPIPGFGIFPAMGPHAVKGGNEVWKRRSSIRPLVQSGSYSRSDEQPLTSRDSNIQQVFWILGLNFSYRKIGGNSQIGYPEELQSTSQPTGTDQQTNSILHGEEKSSYKLSTELLDHKKPNLKSNVKQSEKEDELNGDKNNQKYQKKIDLDTNKNQVKDISFKNAEMVSQDPKSHISSSIFSNIPAYANVSQKNRLNSKQKTIPVSNLFSEKSLQSGTPALPQASLVPIMTKPRMEEPGQFQKIQIALPGSTESQSDEVGSIGPTPMAVGAKFYTTDHKIFTSPEEEPIHNYNNNREVKSEEENGSYVNKIVPIFTNKNHSDFQGHLVRVGSNSPESSNTIMEVGEMGTLSIGTSQSTFGLVNYDLDASPNPLHGVLKKLQIEEKNIYNTENSYSKVQPAQKELSSSTAGSNLTTLKESTFTDGNQLGRKHRLFRYNETNFVHRLKKRTIGSRGSSPKETDNQRLSNMESLGGPMNIDPYDVSFQNTDPSKSSTDLELSSNEMEYLFQAIKSGMKLLMNKIMGNAE